MTSKSELHLTHLFPTTKVYIIVKPKSLQNLPASRNLIYIQSMASFKKLLKLAKRLRSPKGCPWDRSQTIEDMAERMEEEAQEIQEAFTKRDWENLKEELGDVLFNIVLTAQIAEEEGKFTMKEVINDIDEKIRSRHTWVFGKDKAKTPEEALEMWRKNKEAQKAEKEA